MLYEVITHADVSPSPAAPAGGSNAIGSSLCWRMRHTKPTLFWLQSVDDFKVMFQVVAPELLDLEYQIELSDEDCKLLELAQPGEAAVVVIVYGDEAQGGKIAANTRSPLILNLNSRRGMQKILASYNFV